MRPLLLVAAAMLVACHSEPGASNCEKSVSRSVTLDANQDDASMALAIHDCRVDVDACTVLCTRVADGVPTVCNVSFSSSHVHVYTAWLEPDPDANCPIPDFASDAGFIPVDASPVFD